MINYEEIVENLQIDRVKELLDSLQIPWEDKGGFLLMPTVCHNEDVDDASWKLYFYKNTKMFVCYTEDGNMSIFKFLKNYYDTRNIDYDWYKDILQVILNCSASELITGAPKYSSIRDKYKIENTKQLEYYPNGIIDCFIEYWPIEWTNDGISIATMQKFNIRFCTEYNKIIIPHYSVDDRLIGLRGRALNPWEIETIGKYMPFQLEGKWYSHPLSLNLYGLNHTKENIKRNGICYLVESEKAVMQAESFAMDNCCAAVCGSRLNKFQLKLLMKECQPQEIVICFDQEEERGKRAYFDKLYSMALKYKNYANISFIYDRENLLQLKESPTDKGEEVFRKLLARRTIVK